MKISLSTISSWKTLEQFQQQAEKEGETHFFNLLENALVENMKDDPKLCTSALTQLHRIFQGDEKLLSKINQLSEKHGIVARRERPKRIWQSLFTTKIANYLIQRGVEEGSDASKGLCHGLTLLWSYYHFLGKEEDFFQRIERCIEADLNAFNYDKSTPFKDLSEDQQEFEFFAQDLLFLQEQNNKTIYKQTAAEKLGFVSDRAEIEAVKTRLTFISSFPYDQTEKSYKTFYEVLNKIFETDCQIPKSVLISNSNHIVGIVCKDNTVYYYDSNIYNDLDPIDIQENPTEQLRQLTRSLSLLSTEGDRSLNLALEVVTEQGVSLDRCKHELVSNYLRLDPELLFIAATKGRLDDLKNLIDLGGDVNAAKSNGMTPLFYAAECGHEDVVKALIEAGADVDHVMENGWTPLFMAAQNGHDEVVKALIDARADVNRVDSEGLTPLRIADQKGHMDVELSLLKEGASVTQGNSDDWTPLLKPVEMGRKDVVDELIKAGVDVNDASVPTYTPLHAAVEKGHVDVVEALIKAGANVNPTSFYGRTPLFVAADKGNKELVVALIEAGAKVNSTSEDRWIPLNSAAENGHVDVVDVLIEAGADVNSTLEDGRTPLFVAAKNGHKDVVDVLIKAGADVNSSSEDGRTPLFVAAQYGHVDVLLALSSAGAVFAVDSDDSM